MSRAPFHTWRKIYRKCITFIHNCPALMPPAVMLTGKFPIPPPLSQGLDDLPLPPLPIWRSWSATGLLPTYLSFHLQFRMILNAFPKARPPKWSLLMTTLPSEKKKEKRKSENEGRRKSERKKSRRMSHFYTGYLSWELCGVRYFCAEVITSCLY